MQLDNHSSEEFDLVNGETVATIPASTNNVVLDDSFYSANDGFNTNNAETIGALLANGSITFDTPPAGYAVVSDPKTNLPSLVATLGQQIKFDKTSVASAANTAIAVTSAAIVGKKSYLQRIEGSTSAGEALLQVFDGTTSGTLLWEGYVTVGSPGVTFATPLVGTADTVMTVNLGAAGSGNTGTVAAHGYVE